MGQDGDMRPDPQPPTALSEQVSAVGGVGGSGEDVHPDHPPSTTVPEQSGDDPGLKVRRQDRGDGACPDPQPPTALREQVSAVGGVGGSGEDVHPDPHPPMASLGRAGAEGGVATAPRRSRRAARSQPSMWTAPPALTEPQKKRVLAAVVQIVVLVVFQNHCYKFKGRTYRQSRGGAIGLRLTSLVARIVMDAWAGMFLMKLDRVGFRIFAFMKYVDDINIIIRRLKLGFRWVNSRSQVDQGMAAAGRAGRNL